MRKLDRPRTSGTEAYSSCVSGLPLNRRNLYELYSEEIEEPINNYIESAASSNLYNFTPASRGNPEQVILGQLTKADFTYLYERGMVDASCVGREIYDQIKAATEKCPYCSGIGLVETLDHYLPKAYYPQFSVLPVNLVPSCRDCNTGKSSDTPASAGEQVLHPYFDDVYFTTKWLSARVIYQDNGLVIEFFADPPEHWDEQMCQRVISHFSDFKLGRLFSAQVGGELSGILNLRKKNELIMNLPVEEYKTFLLQHLGDDTLELNSWRTAMYSALANDDKFLNEGHLYGV